MHHLCRGTESNFKTLEVRSPWSPLATAWLKNRNSFEDFATFKSKDDYNQIYSVKMQKIISNYSKKKGTFMVLKEKGRDPEAQSSP